MFGLHMCAYNMWRAAPPCMDEDDVLCRYSSLMKGDFPLAVTHWGASFANEAITCSFCGV